MAQIAASIREFGWTNPVMVDGKNGIIAGHGRNTHCVVNVSSLLTERPGAIPSREPSSNCAGLVACSTTSGESLTLATRRVGQLRVQLAVWGAYRDDVIAAGNGRSPAYALRLAHSSAGQSAIKLTGAP
ncbi:hypothetical protein [Mesorhizobium sp.]|uniref:hypothetical protein n=1 Tax=Mesorhizobium sp. TaxID=1871066 RepID=UPI0025CF4DF7|nr:hypothetical protein [Mesorhizobium sp.]